mmetsp:Transcript_22343/g.31147  ORF Transcript_22343/g.31147 Transcript_22343/m.31147 type:complete len:100 (+) Transcript_22343:43-342(+)
MATNKEFKIVYDKPYCHGGKGNYSLHSSFTFKKNGTVDMFEMYQSSSGTYKISGNIITMNFGNTTRTASITSEDHLAVNEPGTNFFRSHNLNWVELDPP